MVVERALDELRIEGTFDDATAEEHPTVASLMRDVLDHGEVHAKWADSEDKVEVRQGTATFDFTGGTRRMPRPLRSGRKPTTDDTNHATMTV